MALYPSNPAGDPISRPLLSKSYRRIGIRRDRNLGDLSSSSESLENLLDSLVEDQTNENFIISDLAAIKNIFASGLDSPGYQNVIGSSTKFTTLDGQIKSYDPRITYQNRLDKFELFSGEPRLAGGNGLTANYFQNDQINFTTLTSFQYNKPGGNPLDPNLSESNVFLATTSEGLIENDNFWEDGEFDYAAKIHPQSVKASGGVMWEGYYIPRLTGRAEFRVQSTGLFTMDFAREDYFEDNDKKQTPASEAVQIAAGFVGAGQTYTDYMRVGISTVVSGTGGVGNEITIPTNRVQTIGIGMTVSGSNIDGVPEVDTINRTTGVITLLPSSGVTNSVSGTLSGSNNVTFSRAFGNSVYSDMTTQVLLAFEKYRIRIRYFYPKVAIGDTVLNNQIRNIEKKVTIHHNPPGSTTIDDLDFRFLYSMDYNFSESAKGVFNNYVDKSVLFGGTVLGEGIGTRNNSNEYVRLKSTSKVDLRYKVKESLEKITKVSSRPGSFEAGSRIVGMDPTSSIEVGNYVFGTNVQPGTRVEQIAINRFLVLSKPLGGSGSQTENLTFIDHRGFVKKITGSGSGLQISGISTALTASPQDHTSIDTDVQPGMVAISDKLNPYTVIDSVDQGSNTLNLSKNVKNTGSMDVYIYQSRGLKDNSIQQFCDRFNTTADGPDVRCLVSNHATTDGDGNATTYTSVGVSTVKVDITPSLLVVSTGWELQGAYFGEDGIAVASVNTSNGVITLASNITKPLPDGAQFTAVSPDIDQNGDYQLCCPPTDTSPPFNASEEGLNTISGTTPNMKLVDGNLVFDSLIIQDTNSNASDAAASGAVTRKIEIKTPLSTSTRKFKILATT